MKKVLVIEVVASSGTFLRLFVFFAFVNSRVPAANVDTSAGLRRKGICWNARGLASHGRIKRKTLSRGRGGPRWRGCTST
jgi:hypothetical protein